MKRLLGNGTKRLTVGQARAGHFFQDCLAGRGLTTTKPIGLPCNNQPFWFRARDRLANYRWAPALPASADVVVIGA